MARHAKEYGGGLLIELFYFVGTIASKLGTSPRILFRSRAHRASVRLDFSKIQNPTRSLSVHNINPFLNDTAIIIPKKTETQEPKAATGNKAADKGTLFRSPHSLVLTSDPCAGDDFLTY
jgi:hypothetical protein